MEDAPVQQRLEQHRAERCRGWWLHVAQCEQRVRSIRAHDLTAATNANAFVLPNQSGAAPTVAGATGFDTAALQPVISDGAMVCPYSKEQVNAQSGSGYTVLTSDCGKLISVSNAADQTLTLPRLRLQRAGSST